MSEQSLKRLSIFFIFMILSYVLIIPLHNYASPICLTDQHKQLFQEVLKEEIEYPWSSDSCSFFQQIQEGLSYVQSDTVLQVLNECLSACATETTLTEKLLKLKSSLLAKKFFMLSKPRYLKGETAVVIRNVSKPSFSRFFRKSVGKSA